MDTFAKLIASAIVSLIVLILLALFISPIYEARHYEQLTGIETSYADAFFLTLDPGKHVVVVESASAE